MLSVIICPTISEVFIQVYCISNLVVSTKFMTEQVEYIAKSEGLIQDYKIVGQKEVPS